MEWRLCLRVVNHRQKWSKLINLKIQKIYQNVLPKSVHKNEQILYFFPFYSPFRANHFAPLTFGQGQGNPLRPLRKY